MSPSPSLAVALLHTSSEMTAERTRNQEARAGLMIISHVVLLSRYCSFMAYPQL